MKKLILFIMLIIIIPVIVMNFSNKYEIISKIKYGSIDNVIIKVKRVSTGEILNVPLEEYVTGVVAGEMPVTFNLEALKAQAVASRTYVLKQKEQNNEYDVEYSTNNQVYLTYETLQNNWADNYDENIIKIKDAVNATKGQVILYNNEIIDALFFSTSNGYTENSEDVFSSSKPYLVSVNSEWDKTESPAFSSSVEVTKQEFLFNLGLSDNNVITISNEEKTSTGRLKRLTINGTQFESKKIRSIFKLKSTSFSINVSDNQVIFNVNGFGHGVGMSQYGANGMAKEGYSYEDIINHYYKNCEIKKIN